MATTFTVCPRCQHVHYGRRDGGCGVTACECGKTPRPAALSDELVVIPTNYVHFVWA